MDAAGSPDINSKLKPQRETSSHTKEKAEEPQPDTPLTSEPANPFQLLLLKPDPLQLPFLENRAPIDLI